MQVPHVTRRALLRLALATPLASGIVAAPTLRTVAAPEPVHARHRQIQLADKLHEQVGPPQLQQRGVRVLGTGRIAAEPFRLTALTWHGELPAGTSLQVRTESRAGHWTPWRHMRADGHAPDPDSPESFRQRSGTDALIVDESSAIELQVRAGGALPNDLRLELVHPGASVADKRHGVPASGGRRGAAGELLHAPASGGRRGAAGELLHALASGERRGAAGQLLHAPASGERRAGELVHAPASGERRAGELLHAPASSGLLGVSMAGEAVAVPTILRRADWGADESVREAGNPLYGEVRGAFVHHTAGSNTYGASDVPGIIRSIYAYHVDGRGWRDIGYNFVIDKFGRIWEGRFGGIERSVVGAHVRGYNSYSVGASVLGTYVSTEPEPAVLEAFERLIAWKFALHGVDPTAVTYPGLKDVPAIAGHRDGGATECPGERLYRKLDVIRGGVANPVTADLGLTSHTSSARAGAHIYFDVAWNIDGEPVTGRAMLQRFSDSGWVNLRGVTVRDGAGVTFDVPAADQSYRLQALATSEGALAGGTSEVVQVAVTTSACELTLTPEGRVVTIDWWCGPEPVTGEVEIQYFGDGDWRPVAAVRVEAGEGSATLPPSDTRVYRARALAASTPPGADLAHPAGTSNEWQI